MEYLGCRKRKQVVEMESVGCQKRRQRCGGREIIVNDRVEEKYDSKPELSYLNEVLESSSTGYCKRKASRNLKSRPPKLQKKDGPQRSSKRQMMNEHRTRGTTKTPPKCKYQDHNDDICSVCQYGGELILCDNCPSSFHQSCLGLEEIPEGDWFCPTCCCGICRQSKIKAADDEKLLTCSQCEHKYHAKCLGEGSVASLGSYLKNWFCGKNCERIYAGLHKLLGEPIAVGENNLNWILLKSDDSRNCDLENGCNDLEEESYRKLNAALSVMHGCFEPLKESYSGRDLLEDVILSRRSKLNRLNFQGFYTILLERNEEVITVANVRVHGERVAEVPLVGTELKHRGLGMCRILMDELEKRLMELGVERIVLPAVPSVVDTWTTSFGFSRMTNSERSQFMDCTFLDFQDTVMCHKLLTKTHPDSALSIGLQEFVSPKEILPDMPEVNYGAAFYKRNGRNGELLTRRKSTEWNTLMLSNVEPYPDSVHQYASADNKKIKAQVKINVRKHIAYLGWKIEMSDRKGNGYQRTHYRYTSPEIEGKKVVYMSLLQVCQYIIEKDANIDSLLSQEDQRIM